MKIKALTQISQFMIQKSKSQVSCVGYVNIMKPSAESLPLCQMKYNSWILARFSVRYTKRVVAKRRVRGWCEDYVLCMMLVLSKSKDFDLLFKLCYLF